MKIYIAVDCYLISPPYHIAYCLTPDKAWAEVANYRAEFETDNGFHIFDVIEKEVVE